MKKKSFVRSSRPRIQRMQVFRLARIVAMLKKGLMPSAEDLLTEYAKLENEDGLLIRASYSIRTVYRDIDTLKNDFKCPIGYDRLNKGYCILDRDWELNCPAQLSESALLALVLGARIAEDVFPNPIRSRISSAVDEILKGNSPDFLDTALVQSMKVFAESGAVEESKIFPVVFEAWQKRRRLRILYDDQKGGSPIERIVEPQVIFLYAREWRIKGYCHLRKANRTFVISRMVKAEMLNGTFAPDFKLIKSLTLDNVVSWEKIRNVKIRLTGDARKFATANKMHTRQTLKKQKDGSWLFTIPEVPEQVIVPWILSQRGDAVPLAPTEIVESVRKGAQKVMRNLRVAKG